MRLRWSAVACALLCVFGATAVHALDVHGVQPYALDHPRAPAYLSPVQGGAPLSVYSKLVERRLFVFDCFLDTAASRIVMCRSDRNALKVESTGMTVEDWGIQGTETFDVSKPYRLHVGDSSTDISDPSRFPFSMRCVLELRQKDRSMAGMLPKGLSKDLKGALGGLDVGEAYLSQALTPAINIIGTPFLKDHVVILDPRPVSSALGSVMGLLGGQPGSKKDPFANLDELLKRIEKEGATASTFGKIKVSIKGAGHAYAAPRIVVPLHMQEVEKENVPVTHARIPMVRGVVLVHNGRKAEASLALDTAGAVSLISTRLAEKLSLDLEAPQIKAMVAGVGEGAGHLKGYWIDFLGFPAVVGGPVIYRRAPVFVADVEGVEGTLGANLFVPSLYLDMSGMTGKPSAKGSAQDQMLTSAMTMLSSMKYGPTPFRRIVIDLPRRRLGLDPLADP